MLPAWILDHPLRSGAAAFAVTLAVSLAVVTVVLIRLPADYFRKPRHPSFVNLAPVPRFVMVALKNLLGLVLVVIGALLSVPGVPGQGVLTILLGMMLMDIPLLRRLERRLVARPMVRRAIDRVRARFGRPPLDPPEGDAPHPA